MKKNQIRIIAGQWRSRQLTFPNAPDLRPTPNRIRETLFNWLAPHLYKATCLDLFSGTGILGFEALSRGAAHVTAVENNAELIETLQKNSQLLKTDHIEIIQSDAILWLSERPKTFDIVFLDPPYNADLLPQCLTLLNTGWLHLNSLVYFESNQPLPTEVLPEKLELLKQKKAGRVYYYLAKYH